MSNVVCHCEEERRSNTTTLTSNVIARSEATKQSVTPYTIPLTWPITPSTVTEVVQLWVPARAFNPLDWLSNVAGVILGVGVIRLIGTRRTTP
jgi:VanZ family protein